MALAFVNRSENSVPATNTASESTAAASLTAGNLLVVCINYQTNAPNSVSGITDTAGNTFTQRGSIQTQSNNSLVIYSAENVAGHASNQVTVTFASENPFAAVAALQFSGAATSGATDGTAGASGSGTAISSGSVTVTAAEAVIVGMAEADGASHAAGGGGFTVTAFAGSNGQYFGTGYKIVSASEAAAWSCGSGAWGIAAAAFKAAAGAPSGNPWYYYAQQ